MEVILNIDIIYVDETTCLMEVSGFTLVIDNNLFSPQWFVKRLKQVELFPSNQPRDIQSTFQYYLLGSHFNLKSC